MTTGIAILLVVIGAGIMKVLEHAWSGSRKDRLLPSSAKMVPFGSLEEGAVFVHFSPPHEYVRPIVLRKNGMCSGQEVINRRVIMAMNVDPKDLVLQVAY